MLGPEDREVGLHAAIVGDVLVAPVGPTDRYAHGVLGDQPATVVATPFYKRPE